MAERFSRLYTLPANLYTEDAPVIIAAGVLLKDNQTGKRLAQLKIQNIDNHTIAHMELRFVLLDASENIIQEYYHSYDGISLAEKDYFGAKAPVELPVKGVCSYAVSIVTVRFIGGTEWQSSDNWNALDANVDIDTLKEERDKRIQERLAKDALAKELRMKEEAEAIAAKEREEAERIAIENQRKAEQRKKILKISPFVAVAVIIIAVIIANICKVNNERAKLRREELAVRDTISAGRGHIVALKADGTVVAAGDNNYGQCNVDSWTDIIAISAGNSHTVGLKADGTAVAIGKNDDGQCNVGGWTDIIAISAGRNHTVGQKADGTVVAVGSNYGGSSQSGPCDVGGWTDIIAIHAGWNYTVGLRSDGRVYIVGDKEDGKEQCKNWNDIIAISGGTDHIVGLKADGTVVAVGKNKNSSFFGQCDVSDWSDVIAISTDSFKTIGLKEDGTVVATGNSHGAEEWTNIIAVNAGDHIIGLRANGTLVAVGCNSNYCDICREIDRQEWADIKVP